MAMTRRNFLEAGVGGVALSLAQGASHAQSPATAGNPTAQAQDTVADLRTVVVGVDGSALTGAYLDEYLSSGANVWQYSDNIIDFDDFQKIQNFVDSQSSKITLAKSYNDILAAKQAGKVAMVVGIQECTQLEPEWFGNPTIINRRQSKRLGYLSRRSRNFPPITTRGSGSPTFPIISPIFLAAAVLTRRHL